MTIKEFAEWLLKQEEYLNKSILYIDINAPDYGKDLLIQLDSGYVTITFDGDLEGV